MAATRPPASKSKKTPVKKPVAKGKKVEAPKAKPAKVAAKPVAKPAPKPAAKPVMKKSAPVASVPKPVVKKPEVSKLTKADIEHFRELLLEKRREILGDVGSMESEAFKSGSNLSNMPIHMADVGTDNFEQEFTLGLIESERQMLREIQEALLRLETGKFGMCVATGKPIAKVRLEAVPWAKYTMEYARALEQGLIRRDDASRDDDTDSDDDED